jgi:hypothetical protein
MLLLSALFAMATVLPQQPREARNAQAIAAAKNVSVRELDSSLPRKSFLDWLNGVVSTGAARTWEINDCGEQTGQPEPALDFPVCAEVNVTLPQNRRLFISLSVGTHQTGVATEPPQFWWAIVVEPDGSKNWLNRLSQVPAAIRSTK